MGKLTIRDIANMAGVSPTVVSFVINQRAGVSRKTREKVLEVIKNTNFQPNMNSRRLTMKKSFNIGIATEGAASPFIDLFYFEIAQGLLDKSREYGYNIVFSSVERKNGIVALPDIIQRGDADGMIFFQHAESYILKEMEEKNIPFVLIDYHGTAGNFCSVNADYVKAAAASTQFLINKGHTDIAFFSLNMVPNFYKQVFTGFSNAMQAAGITIPLNWICAVNDEEEIRASLDFLLSNEKRPTAVFCANDMTAIQAMKYAKKKGLRLPEELSFISIDDILISSYIEPSLTNVHIDKRMMGVKAMDLIMKIINGQECESVLVYSEGIIERKSVADRTRMNREPAVSRGTA